MFAVGDWVANSGNFKNGLPTNPGLVVKTYSVDGQRVMDILWTTSKYLGTQIPADGVLEDDYDYHNLIHGGSDVAENKIVPVNVSIRRHRV